MSLALTSAATQTQSAAACRQNLVKRLHQATSLPCISHNFAHPNAALHSGRATVQIPCFNLVKKTHWRRAADFQEEVALHVQMFVTDACSSNFPKLTGRHKLGRRITDEKTLEKGKNLDPRGCQLNMKCRNRTGPFVAWLLLESAGAYSATHRPQKKNCVSKLACAISDVGCMVTRDMHGVRSLRDEEQGKKARECFGDPCASTVLTC